jgi:hypothetical protein
LDDAFLLSEPENDVLFELAVSKTWLRQQVTVALPLMCRSSYRGVIEFMRDLLGIRISLGTVHHALRSATQQADIINHEQDLSAIRVGLHDEIFQATTPVLAGVCAASAYTNRPRGRPHRRPPSPSSRRRPASTTAPPAARKVMDTGFRP